MSFTKRDETIMHAELTTVYKRVRKLNMVREVAVSDGLEEVNHLRLREKLAARRSYGYDRIDVQYGRWQRRNQGYVCSGDDPTHFQINVYSDCRRPPTPQESTESIWAEMNALKQEPMPLQPPPPKREVSL